MTTRSRFLLLCTAAATIACGDGRVSSGGSFSSTGLDAVLLRVPRSGGIARAHRVGSDSVLFSARDRAPALDGILDFDDFLGVVLLRDANSRILNLDLRLGTVTIPGEERLRGTVVAEGAAAYGLDAQGRIIRVTPSVTWTWPVPGGATSLVPTPDGSLIVLRTDGDGTEWRRVIPPETRVLDSARTAPVRLVERTQAGDRVWAVTNGTLISLRTRDLGQAFEMSLRDSVVALALTPSGDRVFLATDQRRLRVVDRYAESERSAIDLPAPVSALRMIPTATTCSPRRRSRIQSSSSRSVPRAWSAPSPAPGATTCPSSRPPAASSWPAIATWCWWTPSPRAIVNATLAAQPTSGRWCAGTASGRAPWASTGRWSSRSTRRTPPAPTAPWRR